MNNGNWEKVFLRAILTIAVLVSPAVLAGKLEKCKVDTEAGDLCQIEVSGLSPTQAAVGMQAVYCKAYNRLATKSGKKLKKFLAKEKHHVPVIIGPGGKLFITDHHHMSTALYYALKKRGWKEKDYKVTANILYNWSIMNEAGFWDTMAKNNFAYLKDEFGRPISHRDLPDNVSHMHNDPYRTLARWVRDGLGYVKPQNAMYFMEFRWGAYMRDHGTPPSEDVGKCQRHHETGYDRRCIAEESKVLFNSYKDAMRVVSLKSSVKPYFQEECPGESLYSKCGFVDKTQEGLSIIDGSGDGYCEDQESRTRH